MATFVESSRVDRDAHKVSVSGLREARSAIGATTLAIKFLLHGVARTLTHPHRNAGQRTYQMLLVPYSLQSGRPQGRASPIP